MLKIIAAVASPSNIQFKVGSTQVEVFFGDANQIHYFEGNVDALTQKQVPWGALPKMEQLAQELSQCRSQGMDSDKLMVVMSEGGLALLMAQSSELTAEVIHLVEKGKTEQTTYAGKEALSLVLTFDNIAYRVCVVAENRLKVFGNTLWAYIVDLEGNPVTFLS